MVDYLAVERFGRARQSAGRAQIGIARPSIAARVIMREHDTRGTVVRRIQNDLPKREVHAAGVATVKTNVKTSCLMVEMGDPQALDPWILLGKAGREEGARGRWPVQL